MDRHRGNQGRESQRGVSLVIVALGLVALLAMAGLAIDLAALYVARSEAQRAADAAALNGAQGIADPKVRSVSQSVVEAFAAKKAANVGNQNFVAGLSPGLDPANFTSCAAGDVVPAGADMCFDFSNPDDPRVSVVVQRTAARSTGVPLFFMKIFGLKTADVSATATAEAFLAANRLCLKPWLLANCDPYHAIPVAPSGGGGGGKGGGNGKGKGGGGGSGGTGGSPPPAPAGANPNCPVTDPKTGTVVAYDEYFIFPPNPPTGSSLSPCDPSTDANGCIVHPGAADATAVAACGVLPAPVNSGGLVGECLTLKPGSPALAGAPSQYFPMQFPSGGQTPACPSCQASGTQGGAALYQQNIACCNLNTGIISCGRQSLTMKTGNMVGPTSQGVDCLIHESGTGGGGQDLISFLNSGNAGCSTPTGGPLFNICGGDKNPTPGLRGESNIGSSDSVIQVPLYDGGTLCPGFSAGSTCVASSVTIDGYLQVFIKTETNPQGTVYAYVLGVSGCGAVPTSSQVTARLIHN